MSLSPPPRLSAPRPRRSLLYLPGSNARALEKARTLACDGVILDLEDSVAPNAKGAARDQVIDALTVGGFGRREVVVRVNGLETPWGEQDLEALAPAAPDATAPHTPHSNIIRVAVGRDRAILSIESWMLILKLLEIVDGTAL